jgi:hypothetical protein
MFFFFWGRIPTYVFFWFLDWKKILCENYVKGALNYLFVGAKVARFWEKKPIRNSHILEVEFMEVARTKQEFEILFNYLIIYDYYYYFEPDL